MIFEATPVLGALLVRIEPRKDERGFFARLWCREEFAAQGIDVQMVQASVSHNGVAGTVRGLHYSASPSREGKLVRCERGRIIDVIVDLRPGSPTYLRHFAIELSDQGREALYIPPQVAHGFQTLQDDTDVHYMMSDFYRPDLARGVRFDDPAFGIEWPLPVSTIAARDRQYSDFDPAVHAAKPESGTAG